MAKIKWRPRPGTSWREKLERAHPAHGRAFPIPSSMRKSLGRGTMVIPRPTDVDAAMRRVREGRILTISALRSGLARRARADAACPLTTGIFIRIAAEAAEEDRRAGRKRITPYWRTVRDDGSLVEKFPGGVRVQASRLRREGIRIVSIRGKPRVAALAEPRRPPRRVDSAPPAAAGSRESE